MRRMIGFLSAFLLSCLLVSTASLAALPKSLIPVGEAVGLQLNAEGITIVDFASGGESPAQRAGLQKGDVIIAIDGVELKTAKQLGEELADGGDVQLRVEREGKELELSVQPKLEDGQYRLGAYVRDSVSGIGTITFYDPQSATFGALGHGVCDLQSHQLLSIRDGSVVPAQITEIQRGKAGTPGALRGTFCADAPLGTIAKNCEHGLFGALKQAPLGQALPVAAASEVVVGPATIRCNVQGEEIRDYQIEIVEFKHGASENGRNLLLRVTDPELLEKTGGIVQGMSGSPILQNGRLIGAVTHVLVNEPCMGYGILIETMLEAAA